MWANFLRAFANTFVVVYATDSVFTALLVSARIVFARWLQEDTPIPVFGELQSLLTVALIALAVVALPLLSLTRRLPPSVFVPLVASILWLATGGPPFPFVLGIDLDLLIRATAAVQIGILIAVLLRIRELTDGRWLFDASWFSPPLFSGGYFVVYGFLAAAALAGSILVLSSLSLLLGLETLTNGFVRFDSHGASLADRTYELTIDPEANESDRVKRRRIRLVGMMHIGEEEAYRRVFRDLGNASPLTIVLQEGVSDDDELLEAGLSYDGLADFLGVEEQRSIEDYIERDPSDDDSPVSGATIVHADVDLSDFDPFTVTWLEEVGSIYSGRAGIDLFIDIYRSMSESPERLATIQYDILTRRNLNLISWIGASRINYHEIVVPWGALHLPEIEHAVKEMEFELRSSTYIPLISWRTVGKALLGTNRDHSP